MLKFIISLTTWRNISFFITLFSGQLEGDGYPKWKRKMDEIINIWSIADVVLLTLLNFLFIIYKDIYMTYITCTDS